MSAVRQVALRSAPSSAPAGSAVLQRKSACGGKVESGSEPNRPRTGHDFSRVRVAPERKRIINQPGDRFEQEADRMAEAVISRQGAAVGRSAARPHLQRQEARTGPSTEKKPSEEEKYKAALKKTVEALQETPIAKQLKAQAENLGKEFISTVEGKVIAGTALGGALAAIIATNSELPVPIPEIPLDFISPGLKAKLTYEGPVRSPTNVALRLTTAKGVSIGASYSRTEAAGGKPEEHKAGLTFSIPLGASSKPKPGMSENEKFRAETARMAGEQMKFREGLKSGKQRAAEQEAFRDAYWRTQSSNPLALPGLHMPPSLGGLPEKKEEETPVQRKAADGTSNAIEAPAIVHEVLQSPGQPLDSVTRSFMESRFGHDFSQVRVHNDSRSAESARAVNALAYTVGDQIVFGAEQYAPGTAVGQRLLAHELTHVRQQAGGAASGGLDLAEPSSAAEGEASQIADAFANNRPVSQPSIRAPSLIQRQEGAQLAFKADMEQRRQRVESLERTGTATISGYNDGKGKLSGYRLTQKFALKLKNDARPSAYAFVQFIKGELSHTTAQGKAYFPANFAGALYGRSAKDPWLFTDWIVDTPDSDPRFGSHYNLTIQVPTTTFEDSPGIIAKQALPAGLRYQVDARMGVYPWGARIPTTVKEWESMRPTPFKEVAWGWDITVDPDQQTLSVNFK